MKLFFLKQQNKVAPRFLYIADFIKRNDLEGKLLDVGSRNEVLKEVLVDLKKITYFSADNSPHKNYYINLEKQNEIPPNSFELVTCLDVLEHVENIHQAFDSLLSISSKFLIISLPNFSSLRKRLYFLFSGKLDTAKYDLLPTHQGDRHRWLTTYVDIQNFVIKKLEHHHASVIEQAIETIEGQLGHTICRFFPKLRPLFSDRLIFIIKKNE